MIPVRPRTSTGPLSRPVDSSIPDEPGLVLMPDEDLIIHLGAQLPVIEELNGNTEEDSSLQIGVTYDF